MDKHDNHSKTWSDADIRKYLNGELSPREMHDLERAALDDPFLADALEGLVTITPADTGLDHLRSRLAARIEKKEQRPQVVWFRRPALRAAAVVIALAGIGLTVYYSFSDRRRSQEKAEVVKISTAPVAPVQPPAPAATATADSVAKADTPLTAASSDYADADKPAGKTRHADADNPAGLTRHADADKPAGLARHAGVDRLDAAKKATGDKKEEKDLANRLPAAEREVELDKRRSSDADTVLQGAVAGVRIQAPAPSTAERAKALRPLPADQQVSSQQDFFNAAPATLAKQTLVFSGRVLDNNNRPLAGASVFLKNVPKTGTTTDAYGNFDFRFRPRDTTQQMTVALIGYKQTLVSLNTNALTNNVIHLEETKASLNEVVVTGFGAKRKETYAAAPSEAGSERLDTAWLKAVPVIGKPGYQQYLDSAKRSLKLDSTIFGTERISFQVDQKGQITEFKIEHSLSPAHDAALIQLITSGPAWQVLRGRKVRALVSLNFP